MHRGLMHRGLYFRGRAYILRGGGGLIVGVTVCSYNFHLLEELYQTA